MLEFIFKELSCENAMQMIQIVSGKCWQENICLCKARNFPLRESYYDLGILLLSLLAQYQGLEFFFIGFNSFGKHWSGKNHVVT